MPPPPPPAPAPKASAVQNNSHASGATLPFILNGTTREDYVFDIYDCKDGCIPLKVVVSRYLSASINMRSFPCDRLHLILGRLRCLQHALAKYNEGVLASAPAPSFLHYWRRRALDQLSGFGYNAPDASSVLVVIGLPELIDTVEEVFRDDMAAARDLINSGLITFECLSELFAPETPVRGVTGLGGTPATYM
jgi:hypothetical protein